ncbi:MAG: GNAT family N-acetyltransferase [Clostridia bacterium]|nr:GNAT family N-acetyltransferase [Clostridia bacterium]
MVDLELVIPTKKDLWFKKEIKEDPKTMDYNAGYDLSFEGYNRQDGTIATSMKELENVWFDRWINNTPTNFYYYIAKNKTFVGEVYAKYDKTKDSYEIGIVIKAEHRGNGYASTAIGLLCKELQKQGIKKLHHELPETRKAAVKADLNNGFVVVKKDVDGIEKFGKIEKLVVLEKTL